MMTNANTTKSAAEMTNAELRRAWQYLDRLVGRRSAGEEARWLEVDKEWVKRGCP